MLTNTFSKTGCILTHSGIYFNVFEPDIKSIVIEDIIHALANLCRYGGHCDPFYSVAQHSIACSYLVSSENAFCALLHDATEAYLVDLPKPIKEQIEIYNTIEANLYKAISQKFNLPAEIPEEVHKIDVGIREYEWNFYMTKDLVVEDEFFYKKHFKPKSIKAIRKQFLNRYNHLLNKHLLKK